MGSNYIIDGSFQMIRTNPLLTTNLQIVVDSNYNLYLESINSHKYLNNDAYKHFSMSKESYFEDMIPLFYDKLPINIAYFVNDEDDEDIVYNDYAKQFDTLYWSGVGKVKDNDFFVEEFEYFAPLYINKDNLPSNFVILRVDDPAIYELAENDKIISNTTKDNFRTEIIEKWKCVKLYDMTLKSKFGFWLDNNYTNNSRFPKAPLEFDSKKYNFTKWYGIDYFTGVYTDKSLYMEDKLWYENPHFKFEEFITENYKNNELIFPNIANFKFLFDDNPASPFEYKKYSLNRYYGFYVDLELVRTITPYRSKSLITGLKLENNIFMSTNQVTGSTMPFNITWDDDANYYVYALNELYSVVRTLSDDIYYYKIISDKELLITDITRDYEIDIEFNDLDNQNYNNRIKPRTQLSFYLDRLIREDGVEDLYSDLYLININDKYHVIEKKINEIDGLLEHYIRTDYGIKCTDKELTYWIHDINTGTVVNVENKEKPLIFKVYRIKFRDIKDFDFSRIDTGFANFDFNKKDEYSITTEHKLYSVEHRDASDSIVFKYYENTNINSGNIINVSSEYIASDELFEIDKNGLTDIWMKNQSVCKWGYKNSISHSDYPYKLNNSNKVGSLYNKTTDVFSKNPNILSKTHDYFYRIGDFYSSFETQNGVNIDVSYNINYYDNQTLSIETEKMTENYFDIDKYIDSDFDYFDYFFKNNRNLNIEGEYEQTTHYSIFNGGDQYVPSTTLFKGIKYNAFKLTNIIRGDDDLIQQYITDKNINYNGYKFSVILNTKYNDATMTWGDILSIDLDS